MTNLKAVVVYDSNFGNNMKLAQSLSSGLEAKGILVDCMKIGTFNVKKLSEYDLIVAGGPTQIARISKPMRDFFDEISSIDLGGKHGFCFGTRMESKMNRFDINGSAKRIEGRLKKKKVQIIKPRVNVIVEGREGPLSKGSEGLFEKIGIELACLMEAE